MSKTTTTTSRSSGPGRWKLAQAEESQHSIIAASIGEAGAGKTHFWLTAPEPIFYFLFDPGGLKGLLEQPNFKKKKVYLIDYSKKLNTAKLPRTQRVEAAYQTWQEFQGDWDEAVDVAKTLVWDKEEMVWEMLRYAHDEVDSPTPKNFGELNMQYRGLFQDAEARELNFGVIRGMKDTWGITGQSGKTGKDQWGFTGELKPRGQKEVEDLVQVNLWHRWDDDEREFQTKFHNKCRLGPAKKLLGKEFADLDFPGLIELVFPGSDLEDWGY